MAETEPETRATVLLRAASRGDRQAAEELLPAVYEELRRLARHRLAGLPAGQTLQPTALVHEAYMRVIGREDPGWDGRAHFFGAAALAMRNILVDQARRKGRVKRGGDRQRVQLEQEPPDQGRDPASLIALDEALRQLEQMDPRKGRIVSLRYFAGLSNDEIAELLGCSSRTVEREWRFARAWLARELDHDERDLDAAPQVTE